MKKTQYKKTTKKGGCGCQNNQPSSIISGGSSFNVNNPSVNPINNYNSDPNDPSVVLSSRIQPNMNPSVFLLGGKYKNKSSKRKGKKSKRVKKTKRRTIRKQYGGADPVLSSQNANVVSSFNTVSGSQTSANLITGTSDQLINSGNKFNQQMLFI
jgi:hypothetical protein